MNKLLNNFSGGEITPLLDARIDLEKYGNSCRTLENMRALPYGGATYRSGTLYMNGCRSNATASRLIPFTFSTTVCYAIEMCDQFFRFYLNGARLGAPYEIATVFTAAEVFQVQYLQINNVMYLVHPNHMPQKLTRFGDTSWTIAEASWTYPALLDQNIGTTTITPSAITGAINLVASSALWNANHVGAYWEISYRRDGSSVTPLDISITSGSATSGSLKVKGDWSVVTTNYWYGTLSVQRSRDGGSAWETIRTFSSKSDRNVNGSGSEDTDVLLRLSYTSAGNPFGSPDPWTGTPPATYTKAQAKLESSEVFVEGLVRITAFTDSTHVAATVINPLDQSVATKYWAEGAWSASRGYPRTVTTFEQRLMYGGTATAPNTVWGSVTADYDNIQYNDTDDAAIQAQFAAAQQNPIQWMDALLRIHAGTSGSEVAMASGNSDEPLTPSNVTMRSESYYGSEYMQALRVDNALLFIQRQGRKLRELRESSPYANPGDYNCADLTLFAEHITQGGIVQMAYARQPDPTVYLVRGDGQLLVLTYNKEQNVFAFARYITDGAFESVCAVYGASADVVYVTVRRTINGNTVRYAEVFTAELADKTNGVYVDSAIAYAGSPINVVTGLGSLEAKTVRVVADGQYIAGLTVSGGQITLPSSKTASVIRVGLGYDGTLLPMKLDEMFPGGTTQGLPRNVEQVVIRLQNSLGGRWGNAKATNKTLGQYANDIQMRQPSDTMDASPVLRSGDFLLQPWPLGTDYNADVLISQTQPFPFTVLGLFVQVKTYT